MKRDLLERNLILLASRMLGASLKRTIFMLFGGKLITVYSHLA